jgi:hypothetical protein
MSDIITAILCGELFQIIIFHTPLNGKNPGWLSAVSIINPNV